MARPRQISTEDILKVACECFLENGIHISTQAIAERVGLSQPALFKRFKTKRDLILAALAPPERLPIIDWIEAGPEPGDLQPQMRELATKLWETLQWIFPRLAVLHLSKIDPKQIRAHYKTFPLINLLNAIAAWISRAQQMGLIRSDGNHLVWAQNLMGTLQGRAFLKLMLRIPFGESDDEAYLIAAVDLLFNGMKLEKADD